MNLKFPSAVTKELKLTVDGFQLIEIYVVAAISNSNGFSFLKETGHLPRQLCSGLYFYPESKTYS